MKDYVAEVSKSKPRVVKTNSLLSSGILHTYQLEGANFLIDNPKSALWWQPGLGKTLTTLTVLDYVQPKRTLLVAPLRCIHNVWPLEIQKWCPEMGFTLLTGGPQVRSKKIRQWNKGIMLVNYEKLPWLAKEFPELFALVDCIIFDEASKLKARRSQRFKLLKNLVPPCPRVHQLTGSPAPNGLLDVWSQIYLLDKGERLGKFIGHYKDRYFESDYMGWTFTPRKNAPKKIHDKLKDITHVLSAEGLIDMPELRLAPVPVEVKTPAYREMQKDGVVTKFDVVAESGAAVQNKLRQLANGFVYDEDKVAHEVHYHKLTALTDLLDELAGYPVIVFYEFQEDRRRILDAVKNIVEFSDDKVKRWNKGKIPVMLMSPWSAGHGLNLQEPCHHVIWYGPTWDLEANDQATARVWRQGNTKSHVVCYYLTGTDTLDEYVLEVLEQKERTQDDMLDALERHRSE
jgi:hypothetical protein